MKLLQITFIAVLGITCLATYATSETLHGQRDVSAQMVLSTPIDT